MKLKYLPCSRYAAHGIRYPFVQDREKADTRRRGAESGDISGKRKRGGNARANKSKCISGYTRVCHAIPFAGRVFASTMKYAAQSWRRLALKRNTNGAPCFRPVFVSSPPFNPFLIRDAGSDGSRGKPIRIIFFRDSYNRSEGRGDERDFF